MKKSYQLLIGIAFVLVALFGVTGFVVSQVAWTNPSSPPPAGNVAPPLNTSADFQEKQGELSIRGGLGLGGFFAEVSKRIIASINGSLYIGSDDPVRNPDDFGTIIGQLDDTIDIPEFPGYTQDSGDILTDGQITAKGDVCTTLEGGLCLSTLEPEIPDPLTLNRLRVKEIEGINDDGLEAVLGLHLDSEFDWNNVGSFAGTEALQDGNLRLERFILSGSDVRWQLDLSAQIGVHGAAIGFDSEGNAIVAGTSATYPHSLGDLHIMKLAKDNGDTEWGPFVLSNSHSFMPSSIEVASDDSFIVIGSLRWNGATRPGVFMTKFDRDGNLQWQQYKEISRTWYPGSPFARSADLIDVQFDNSDNLIVTYGDFRHVPRSYMGNRLEKLNGTTGNIIWGKDIDFGGNLLGKIALNSANDIYLFRSPENGKGVWMAKYNSAGGVRAGFPRLIDLGDKERYTNITTINDGEVYRDANIVMTDQETFFITLFNVPEPRVSSSDPYTVDLYLIDRFGTVLAEVEDFRTIIPGSANDQTQGINELIVSDITPDGSLISTHRIDRKRHIFDPSGLGLIISEDTLEGSIADFKIDRDNDAQYTITDSAIVTIFSSTPGGSEFVTEGRYNTQPQNLGTNALMTTFEAQASLNGGSAQVVIQGFDDGLSEIWTETINLNDGLTTKDISKKLDGTSKPVTRYTKVSVSLFRGSAQSTPLIDFIHVNTDQTASTYVDFLGTSIKNVGKLNVNTIDPIYKIGDEFYATYVPDSIGKQVQLIGKGELVNGVFEYDFSNAPKESDEWLFWNAIKQDSIVVSVTPASEARFSASVHEGIFRVTSSENLTLPFDYILIAKRFDEDGLYRINEKPSVYLNP